MNSNLKKLFIFLSVFLTISFHNSTIFGAEVKATQEAQTCYLCWGKFGSLEEGSGKKTVLTYQCGHKLHCACLMGFDQKIEQEIILNDETIAKNLEKLKKFKPVAQNYECFLCGESHVPEEEKGPIKVTLPCFSSHNCCLQCYIKNPSPKCFMCRAPTARQAHYRQPANPGVQINEIQINERVKAECAAAKCPYCRDPEKINNYIKIIENEKKEETERQKKRADEERAAAERRRHRGDRMRWYEPLPIPRAQQQPFQLQRIPAHDELHPIKALIKRLVKIGGKNLLVLIALWKLSKKFPAIKNLESLLCLPAIYSAMAMSMILNADPEHENDAIFSIWFVAFASCYIMSKKSDNFDYELDLVKNFLKKYL